MGEDNQKPNQLIYSYKTAIINTWTPHTESVRAASPSAALFLCTLEKKSSASNDY